MIYSRRLDFVIRIKVCTQSVCSHPDGISNFDVNKLHITHRLDFSNHALICINCNFRCRPNIGIMGVQCDKIGAMHSNFSTNCFNREEVNSFYRQARPFTSEHTTCFHIGHTRSAAFPESQFCARHIMQNTNQQLSRTSDRIARRRRNGENLNCRLPVCPPHQTA